jgi:Zn-finger nucleic acid-binding protein
MASCPKCQTPTLMPTMLSGGLSVKGCSRCGGVLVDLLAYRAWADQRGIDVAGAPRPSAGLVDDTSRAIACPNCAAVMIKYRIASEAGNKLDYCANCDEVWLDGGEWQQLEDLGLQLNLGTLLTEPWQRRVRHEAAARTRDARLREQLGADFARIAEFREWLNRHPQRARIAAWLADPGDD